MSAIYLVGLLGTVETVIRTEKLEVQLPVPAEGGTEVAKIYGPHRLAFKCGQEGNGIYRLAFLIYIQSALTSLKRSLTMLKDVMQCGLMIRDREICRGQKVL